jgi:hypothetical protein
MEMSRQSALEGMEPLKRSSKTKDQRSNQRIKIKGQRPDRRLWSLVFELPWSFVIGILALGFAPSFDLAFGLRT